MWGRISDITNYVQDKIEESFTEEEGADTGASGVSVPSSPPRKVNSLSIARIFSSIAL